MLSTAQSNDNTHCLVIEAAFTLPRFVTRPPSTAHCQAARLIDPKRTSYGARNPLDIGGRQICARHFSTLSSRRKNSRRRCVCDTDDSAKYRPAIGPRQRRALSLASNTTRGCRTILLISESLAHRILMTLFSPHTNGRSDIGTAASECSASYASEKELFYVAPGGQGHFSAVASGNGGMAGYIQDTQPLESPTSVCAALRRLDHKAL